MERLAHDDIEPQTQTSAALRGGVPPIPPHNRPPVATAVGMPDPEANPEDIRGIIECASEEEARATIRQMGYHVTKIAAKRSPERPVRNKEQQTALQSTMRTIQELYWSARDNITDFFDTLIEADRRANR